MVAASESASECAQGGGGRLTSSSVGEAHRVHGSYAGVGGSNRMAVSNKGAKGVQETGEDWALASATR